jgi:hypothetical protein
MYSVGLSKPFDSSAATGASALEALVAMPPSKRKNSAAQTQQFVAMVRSDSRDRKLVGILGLAWSADEGSAALLKKLHQDADAWIRGMAGYALLVRSLSGRPAATIPASLCLFLGKSKEPSERMFLANRLAVDYPKTSMWAIWDAARAETDPLVRCDMLYYLVKSPDAAIAAEVLRFKWGRRVSPSEGRSFLLGTITPGRPKDDMRNSSDFLLNELRARMKGRKPNAAGR